MAADAHSTARDLIVPPVGGAAEPRTYPALLEDPQSRQIQVVPAVQRYQFAQPAFVDSREIDRDAKRTLTPLERLHTLDCAEPGKGTLPRPTTNSSEPPARDCVARCGRQRASPRGSAWTRKCSAAGWGCQPRRIPSCRIYARYAADIRRRERGGEVVPRTVGVQELLVLSGDTMTVDRFKSTLTDSVLQRWRAPNSRPGPGQKCSPRRATCLMPALSSRPKSPWCDPPTTREGRSGRGVLGRVG